MPLDYEDRTDISNSPPTDRVRTPKMVADQAAKETNQSERRPGMGSQKSDGQNPLQGVGDVLGGLGQDVKDAGQQAGDVVSGAASHASSATQQALQNASKAAIDWGNEWNSAPANVWGFSRSGYRALSGTYSDGVSNLFASHDAAHRLGQLGAGFLADSIPLVGLQESASNLMNLEAEREGRITDAQRKAALEQIRQQAVQGAPGTAASDLAMVVPGRAASLGAQAGVPLLASLLGGNQDDQNAALWWAAIGTVLTFGHLAGPVRDLLRERFGNASGFERFLQDMRAGNRDAGRASLDPQKSASTIKDYISAQVNRGGLAPFSKTIAKGAEKDAPTRVTAELGPAGEIRIDPQEAAKRRTSVLSKLGVSDLAELEQKAGTVGGFTGKQAKLIRDNWKTLGLPYDLVHRAPGEAALRDPRAALGEITNENTAAAVTSHVADVNHYLEQIHSGLFATSRNPAQAVLRSLAGHSRITDLLHGDYMRSLSHALGGWLTPGNDRLLWRAAEGDHDIYVALPPEARAVVDGFALLRAAAREQSQGTQYAKSFTPYWVPRLDVLTDAARTGPGRPSSASVLAREARKKRATAINLDPSTGHLVVGQRFNTVAEANAALGRAREGLVAHLTDTSTKLRKDFVGDPEAQTIRKLVATDSPQATQRAQQLALDRFPNKADSFVNAVGRGLGYQVRAVGTAKALRELEQSTILSKHPSGTGNVLRRAVVQPKTQRALEEFAKQGYQSIDDPRFRGYMFDGGFAEDLNRYVNHVNSSPTRTNPWFKGLLDLEKQLVSWIMFSPLVHGMNMAGRFGFAALGNPLEMAKYLRDGKGFLPHLADDESYQLRREAWQAGVLPMRRAKGWADNVMSSMHDALGEVEPPVDDMPAGDKAGRMRSLTAKGAHVYEHVNDYFWGAVHDFAVTMYHLEKTAALKHGVDETSARLFAARRANSWAGLVAPEDTNPLLHDASKLVAFAPNWWRTWAELMVPLYRRTGYVTDSNMVKHIARQGAKTMAAAYAFQHMTGNPLNYLATSSTPWALDGHLQNENQPQNRDRIEATGAWLNDIPIAGHFFSETPAVDPKTGAVRTIENPFARQQYASELAAGLQSGHPDWQPSDVQDGMSKFVAGRMSPLLTSLGAALNIDLYQSIVNRQARAVLQGQEPETVSPGSIFAGAMFAVPGGQQFLQNMERNVAQNPNDNTSLFGTTVPNGINGYLPGIGSAAERGVFSMLTGTNAPYGSAEKTRGQTISDQDYEKVRAIQAQYQQQMTVMGAEALSGQMTPAQWRTRYADLANRHAAQMDAIFKGSPDYVNGGDGLATDYSNLYDQATAPDGTVDQSKLFDLQSQFKAKLTPEQLQAMNAVLHKNDTKFPMLALYHKTLDAYDQWQEGWAAESGVDVSRLRGEASAYSALFGDAHAQRTYLQQHPDLRAFQRAKTNQFEKTREGLLYSAFHGQTATLSRYLQAHHMTAAQFAAQEEATTATP